MLALCWPHPVGEVNNDCGPRKESVLGMNNDEAGMMRWLEGVGGVYKRKYSGAFLLAVRLNPEVSVVKDKS